jgi:hypothetical protein
MRLRTALALAVIVASSLLAASGLAQDCPSRPDRLADWRRAARTAKARRRHQRRKPGAFVVSIGRTLRRNWHRSGRRHAAGSGKAPFLLPVVKSLAIGAFRHRHAAQSRHWLGDAAGRHDIIALHGSRRTHIPSKGILAIRSMRRVKRTKPERTRHPGQLRHHAGRSRSPLRRDHVDAPRKPA